MKRVAGVWLLLALVGCARQAADPSLGLPPLPAVAAAPSPAMVDLGRKLFMDRRLSRNNTMSCAMCHVPEQGFAAHELATSVGIEGHSLRRNAPTLLNVAYVGALFHDGRSASLEHQAWAPLLNPIEMGNDDAGRVIEKIRLMPDYAGKFEAAFRVPADVRTVGAALAGYQRTLIAAASRFDRWRYGRDANALTAAEQAGFAVFSGKGRCIVCHTVGDKQALFADGRFHNTGIGFSRSSGARDAARRHTVQLAPGVFTDISAGELASVSEPEQDDTGRHEVTQQEDERWAYRTPTLRNVSITAPYMHDGSLATIEQVIDYYQGGGIDNPGKSALVQPLALTADDKRHLVAFLRSLTSEHVGQLAKAARAERSDYPVP